MPTDKAARDVPTGEARLRIDGGLAHFPGLAAERILCFEDLAACDRRELLDLVDQTSFFDREAPGETARPDARTYTLTMTINGRTRQMRITEPVGDLALARLLSCVRRLAARRADGR
jgi:hypothetical protein